MGVNDDGGGWNISNKITLKWMKQVYSGVEKIN